MKIVVYRAGNRREWRFRVRSKSNKVICQGEGYKNQADALLAIRKLRLELHSAELEILNGPKDTNPLGERLNWPRKK